MENVMENRTIWQKIKWWFNFITSIIMNSIIVILVLIGFLFLAYYIDVTKNEFAPSALGFVLYDSDNNKIAKGWIPKVGKVLMSSNIYLKSGETKNFTVLIWLQENNQNQDYEQGNTFVGGFDIDARQIKYE